MKPYNDFIQSDKQIFKESTQWINAVPVQFLRKHTIKGNAK